MKESGIKVEGMVKGSSNGMMALFIRDHGKMTKQTAKGNWCMPMETFMREIGKMIWQTGMVSTPRNQVPNIQVIGRMTCKTAKAKKFGLMGLFMREFTRTARKTGLARLFFRIIRVMRGSSEKTTFMGMAFICGIMENNTKENGSTTKCMAKGRPAGPTAKNT